MTRALVVFVLSALLLLAVPAALASNGKHHHKQEAHLAAVDADAEVPAHVALHLGAEPVCADAASSIGSGQSLCYGKSLTNGKAALTMKTTGELVASYGDNALWSSKSDFPGAFASMQLDGNLVVYAPDNGITSRCRTLSTTSKFGAENGLNFLDRLTDGSCSVGEAMTRFWIRRDPGDRDQYYMEYKCCALANYVTYTAEKKSTPKNEAPQWRLEYIDRHTADCESDAALLQAWGGATYSCDGWFCDKPNPAFYLRYTCLNPQETYWKLSSCQDMTTKWDSFDPYRLIYLDRHVAECPDGKAITRFRVERSNDNLHYVYRCCALGATKTVQYSMGQLPPVPVSPSLFLTRTGAMVYYNNGAPYRSDACVQTQTSTINMGEALCTFSGQSQLVSANGKYRFVLNGDGSAYIVTSSGNRIWNHGTAAVANNGNAMIMITPDRSLSSITLLNNMADDLAFQWAKAQDVLINVAQLTLRDDGNLVFTQGALGYVVFQSNTAAIDCRVSAWSAWSACSNECGGGSQRRNRNIDVDPKFGGAECPALVETQSCNLQPCTVKGAKTTSVVYNGVTLEWESVDATATSMVISRVDEAGTKATVATLTGDALASTKSYVDKTIRTNTKYTYSLTATNAAGASTPTTLLVSVPGTPIDCQVSELSGWSTCSASCGGGVRTATREILVLPKNGGAACPSVVETKPCAQQPCGSQVSASSIGWDSVTLAFDRVDPVATTLTIVRTETDSGASKTFTVAVEDAASLKSWTDSDVKPTFTYSYAVTASNAFGPSGTTSTTVTTVVKPTDCVVSAWSEWTACSVSCSGGKRTRSRSIITPALNNGAACPVDMEQSEDCNTLPCPVSDFHAGTVTYSTVSLSWSTSVFRTIINRTEHAAEETVRTISLEAGKTSFTDRVAAETRYTYAIYAINQAGELSDASKVTVSTPGKPVNCKVSDWSAWSTCSVGCGGGVSTSERVILIQAQNGGLECPKTFQTRPCNLQPCAPDLRPGAIAWNGVELIWGTVDPTAETMTLVRTDGKTGEVTEISMDVKASSYVDEGVSAHGQYNYDLWTWNQLGGKSAASSVAVTTPGKPVDCKVSEWTEFSKCTVACGGGTRTRTRAIVQTPANGGLECPSPMSETVTCNTKPCPPAGVTVTDVLYNAVILAWETPKGLADVIVNRTTDATGESVVFRPAKDALGLRDESVEILTSYTYTVYDTNVAGTSDAVSLSVATPGVPVDCIVTEFTEWTQCSASCDGGVQSASRAIIQAPQYAGIQCPALWKARACNAQPCPIGNVQAPSVGYNSVTLSWNKASKKSEYLTIYREDEDGLTKSWVIKNDEETWTDVSVDAETTYTYSVVASNADGDSVATELVVHTRGRPVNCQVSAWSAWSTCSAACGGGQRTRSRTVLTAAANGGAECPEELAQSMTCGAQPCALSQFAASEVTHEKVTLSWVPVSGSVTLTRTIAGDDQPKVYLVKGGASSFTDEDVSPLKSYTYVATTDNSDGTSEPVSVTTTTPAVPVDCVVSEPSAWSPCSVQCGGGLQTSSRSIVVAPRNGGKSCPANLGSTRVCNAAPCPVQGLHVEAVAWNQVSLVWTSVADVESVESLLLTRTKADGSEETTFEIAKTEESYVDAAVAVATEYSYTLEAVNAAGKSKPSTVPATTSGEPVDCQVSEWSHWSTCSAACNGGFTSRSRSVTVSPLNGGADCPADLTQRQSCNSKPCPVTGFYAVSVDHSSVTVAWDAIPQHLKVKLTIRRQDVDTEEAAEFEIDDVYSTTNFTDDSVSQTSKYKYSIVMTNKAGSSMPATLVVTTPGKPVNCDITEWSEWSTCSVPCGGGMQSRSRTILAQPAFGGDACPTDLFEEQECQLLPCPVQNLVTPESKCGSIDLRWDSSPAGAYPVKTYTVTRMPVKISGKTGKEAAKEAKSRAKVWTFGPSVTFFEDRKKIIPLQKYRYILVATNENGESSPVEIVATASDFTPATYATSVLDCDPVLVTKGVGLTAKCSITVKKFGEPSKALPEDFDISARYGTVLWDDEKSKDPKAVLTFTYINTGTRNSAKHDKVIVTNGCALRKIDNGRASLDVSRVPKKYGKKGKHAGPHGEE